MYGGYKGCQISFLNANLNLNVPRSVVGKKKHDVVRPLADASELQFPLVLGLLHWHKTKLNQA
jgi:hypothetical protein